MWKRQHWQCFTLPFIRGLVFTRSSSQHRVERILCNLLRFRNPGEHPDEKNETTFVLSDPFTFRPGYDESDS